MFVRTEACKHQIRITDVWAERLQDISGEDCLKEGIQRMLTGCEYYQYSFYDNDKSMNMKQRVKDAIHVLLGNKIAIDKETSIYDIVGWKYNIVRPSYKEAYSEISIKLKELSDMALRLSIGFQI